MKNAHNLPAPPSGDDAPHKPHDMLSKVLFKRPHLTVEILQAGAPEKLLALLNLDTLRLADPGFVDKKLSEDFADILFTCDTKEGDPVAMPFIFENKSTVPTYPNYQVMSYQFQLWGQQIHGGKGSRPTPIVTVIFYHGKDNWEVKSWKKFLKGYRKEFKPYTPKGSYIFINLSGWSDKRIKQFRSGFLITSLLMMKHRFEKDFLLDNLQEIFTFVEADGAEEDVDNRIENLKYAISYLHGIMTVRWEEAKTKLQSLKLTKKVMTAFESAIEYWIETTSPEERYRQVMSIRIEKARAAEKFNGTRNMIHLNFPDETNAGIMEMPLDFVLDVRKQIEKEPEIIARLKKGKQSVQKIADELKVSDLLVEAVKRDLGKKKKK